MDIITFDAETYYDRDYSLSKLTTEQYIRDPRFEVIGVSVKENDAPAVWYSGPDVGAFLHRFDWENSAALAHHAAFDGAILAWRFGIIPKFWLDTLSMARSKHLLTIGVSLRALSEHYQIGNKGDAVYSALGKHLSDFSKDDLFEYSCYCLNDNNLTYNLFNKLKENYPRDELLLIDQTIKMFTEPSFLLDRQRLETHLKAVRESKQALLDKIVTDRTVLMSNPKFAECLKSLGVEPPMKVSKTTGKPTYAFAKTDKELTELLKHSDETVQAVVAARLGLKSTLEETRTEAFIGVSNRGKLPIMLNYYGAHTGRFSGGDGLNPQNLTRKSELRYSMCAPPGKVVVSADSSQIEARIVAYLAKQEDLLEAFREKRDIYSEFATEIYGRPITNADQEERFVGKTCLAEGSMVLTDSGWTPIERVSTFDKVWDGLEWVTHKGLLYQGQKETINLAGLNLTPDHDILLKNKWVRAGEVAGHEGLLSLALATALGNSQSSDTPKPSTYVTEKQQVDRRSLFFAIAGAVSMPFLLPKLLSEASLNARYAPAGGWGRQIPTAMPWPTHTTGGGIYQRFPPPSLGATTPRILPTQTMAEGALKSLTHGEKIGPSILSSSKRSKVGTIQNSNSTASTSTETTSPATSASLPDPQTNATSEPLPILSERLHVYDLASCGPRNRFVALTERGPIIVHNCILGLGYGMGAARLKDTLAIGQGGIKVFIDEFEAQRIVGIYRTRNHKIAALWARFGHCLTDMARGNSGVLLEHVPGLTYDPDGVNLPNGMKIYYPELEADDNQLSYKSRKQRTKIYGGKVVENVTQALARIVIGENMIKLGKKYKLALQVHDEIVGVVPEALADVAKTDFVYAMSTAPTWAPTLPVACKPGVGKNYGECK